MAVRRQIVVVSDTHSGCQLALMPQRVKLDNGCSVTQSKFQRQLAEHWAYFWQQWVPEVTQGEPYTVVHNGDAIDGMHHGATTTITNNLEIQREIAYQVLAPVVDQCAEYYHLRGTEAHVGKSGEHEEELAKRLGAIPDKSDGTHHAQWELWMECGSHLVHFAHHVGTTGSQSYESTAVMKELTEQILESGRWGQRRPDCIVRSHRHRNIEIRIPTGTETDAKKKRAYIASHAIAVVTPAWQGKTPFCFKIAGARVSQPQFGGIIIREADSGELYVRSKVWSLSRGKVV